VRAGTQRLRHDVLVLDAVHRARRVRHPLRARDCTASAASGRGELEADVHDMACVRMRSCTAASRCSRSLSIPAEPSSASTAGQPGTQA
jgi:hypothetical protein